MADFNVRVKLKKDSESNWETSNPVLLDGELGLSIDANGKIHAKIGDGVSAYSQLPYSFEGGESVTSVISSAKDWSGTTADTQATYGVSLLKSGNINIPLGGKDLVNGTYSCVVRLKSSTKDTTSVDWLNFTVRQGSASGTIVGQATAQAKDIYRTDGYCTLSFPCEIEGQNGAKNYYFTLTSTSSYSGTLRLDYVSLQLAGATLLSL